MKDKKKSSFRSKHNENYWKGNSPFASFGMGASSLINGKRITRPKTLKKYY
jgi:oxygen-independent coproporphyrinogen-3 oxidase